MSRASRRVMVGAAVLAVALVAMLGVASLVAEHEEPVTATTVADSAAQRELGRYLALAGNCATCHTVSGGAPYAGGREIHTPFGVVYSSNLTPDAATGLGAWSADDFWRAMHHGKSRDGRLLVPAFPYVNTTLITRADSDALFAWLRTLPAVPARNQAPRLRFPYNQALALRVWRAIYFRPGEFVPDAARSAAWNRGAYLVEGLGHCNACHGERDRFGGVARGDHGGGLIPVLDWMAPALTGAIPGGPAERVRLLQTGVSAVRAVHGPMAETVARSLQHLSEPDLRAMVEYLASLPDARKHAARAPDVSGPAYDETMARGGRLYGRHCADCHGKDGRGAPPAYPPLAGNAGMLASPVNPIRLVLNGGYPPATGGNPRPHGMPPFRHTLDAEEVAAVISFARNSWGNRGSLVSPIEVQRFAAVPVE